jgi:hypothetical protein
MDSKEVCKTFCGFLVLYLIATTNVLSESTNVIMSELINDSESSSISEDYIKIDGNDID